VSESPISTEAGSAIALIDNSLSESSKRITDVFNNCFNSVFKNNKTIHDIFFCLTKKLNKFFSISNSILIVYSETDSCLKAIASKGSKARHGLVLSLPREDSFLYSILDQGQIFTQNYPEELDCNFIEEKLLFQEETNSIAICPVRCNGSLRALLCLTSPIHYAFSMIDEGMLDGILHKFGEAIYPELERLPL